MKACLLEPSRLNEPAKRSAANSDEALEPPEEETVAEAEEEGDVPG